MLGPVDIGAAERALSIPAVPVWPEPDIDPDGYTLAAFHGPHCECGRPFGINYDVEAMVRHGYDPNETLLHEVVHAWQYYNNPTGADQLHVLELAAYGYWDAPFEREARALARMLAKSGVQVWFPERMLFAEPAREVATEAAA